MLSYHFNSAVNKQTLKLQELDVVFFVVIGLVSCFHEKSHSILVIKQGFNIGSSLVPFLAPLHGKNALTEKLIVFQIFPCFTANGVVADL